MPSSYTQSLRLTLQATGENDNTWGAIENDEVISRLDSAVAGAATIPDAGAVTLTSVNGGPDQARMHCLVCTGVAKVITAPGVPKTYLVDASGCSGSVTLTTGSGATAVVEAGNRAFVNCPDGVNFNLVRDTNIAATAAQTLAAAKAYTDNQVVASSAALPGSSTPQAVVYTDPVTGKAVWHVLTEADVAGLAADLAAQRNLALAFSLSF